MTKITYFNLLEIPQNGKNIALKVEMLKLLCYFHAALADYEYEDINCEE